MDDLGAQQLRLIERARAFLVAQGERGVDVAIAPECYLNGWSRGLGNARLRRLARRSPISTAAFVVARIKDALRLIRQSDCEIVGGGAPTHGFEYLVVSWSLASDFKADGQYEDRYFRTSSRESPDTLWLLIAIDQFVPRQLDPNIRIFRQRSRRPRLDSFILLRSVAKALTHAKRSGDGTRPVLSAAVTFANRMVAAVVATLEGGSFRCVALPYEAQPFQQAIFRAAKRRSRTMMTVGYLHAGLAPLPTDMIHRDGAPELLLIHGPGQADLLTRHLGWSQSALRAIPSLRYRAADVRPLGGFIFLPYSFTDPHVISAAFGDFLFAMSAGSLPALTVRNHPVMGQSKPHRRLGQRLEATMRGYPDRFSTGQGAKPVSVFIGATAAILEALERGVMVVHICSQPLTESYSAQVWTNLKVERLGKHVFSYQLSSLGSYIRFGTESDMFSRYIGGVLKSARPEHSINGSAPAGLLAKNER